MPEISILLPVRNAKTYLSRSLASLWRQTWTDFEVIAVDDGSSDGSGELLERAAQREPRLRVVHTPPQGLPAALNTGLAAARGALIARHDADDLSAPRRLELQREVLRGEPRVAVVGSRIRLFPDTQVGAGMRRWAAWHNSLMTHESMANEILIDSTLVHGTALMRRGRLEKIGGWHDRRWAEDVDLWMRLLAGGARFAKRREVLYAWRQHPDSATRRDPRYRRERLLELKRDALERDLLRGGERATLVGVGKSLAMWRDLLVSSCHLHVVEAAHPSQITNARLYPPLILIFGALNARRRWREYLTNLGMIEGRAFIFVA